MRFFADGRKPVIVIIMAAFFMLVFGGLTSGVVAAQATCPKPTPLQSSKQKKPAAKKPAKYQTVPNIRRQPGITPTLTRIYPGLEGVQADADILSPGISADGRFIVYATEATNLDPQDLNDYCDVYVKDLRTGTYAHVSVPMDRCLPGYGDSSSPVISANGRYVAFESEASNLVPRDSNNKYDVFVRDLWTATTYLVSVNSDGVQGNGNSGSPAISADGRYVAFESEATNLSANDTNLRETDVFVYDRVTGLTRRISGQPGEVFLGVPPKTQQNQPQVPGAVPFDGSDGFNRPNGAAPAGNTTETTTAATPGVETENAAQTALPANVGVTNTATRTVVTRSHSPRISAGGRYVLYESDVEMVTPDCCQDNLYRTYVFLYDMDTGLTTQMAVSREGEPANATCGATCISPEGTCVTFYSTATNLTKSSGKTCPGLYSRNVETGAMTRIATSCEKPPEEGKITFSPATVCNRASLVAFESGYTELAPRSYSRVSDIFLYDRRTGELSCISKTPGGASGDAPSTCPVISANGRYIIFTSKATNLVPGDTNGTADIYLYDRGR